MHPNTRKQVTRITVRKLPALVLEPYCPMYGKPQRDDWNVRYWAADGRLLVGAITGKIDDLRQKFPNATIDFLPYDLGKS